MNKLNVKALGLTLGIVWGAGMLLLGLMSDFWNWGLDFVTLMGSVYVGYNSTLGGVLIGTVWGFCDGVICGVLIAWVYNKLSK
jgi:hypothetical protein